MTFLLEFCLNLCEEGDIFLDGEAADKAEDMVAVFGIAFAVFGTEEVGIDAARHEEALAAGGALKEGAELGIGREEDFGNRVELGGCGHGEIFDFLLGGF